MPDELNADADQLWRQVAILRDIMLTVHYYEESHWLAAAVSFPHICTSPLAQDALRRAATIAWQMGFVGVTHWLNRDLLATVEPECDQQKTSAGKDPMRLPPVPDSA
jgi:hypothetical protein